MDNCELLATCGFFKKYAGVQSIACARMTKDYCKGPKMNECKRKEYRKQHGTPPPDDMMPSGNMYRFDVKEKV